jgi:hypothetical protein
MVAKLMEEQVTSLLGTALWGGPTGTGWDLCIRLRRCLCLGLGRWLLSRAVFQCLRAMRPWGRRIAQPTKSFLV